ncbi:MAG: aspartate kinase [Salinispira sp.]
MCELIVQKFGGTSVGSADMINRVLKIAREQQEKQPLVLVASAMGGATSALERMGEHAAAGRSAAAADTLRQLKNQHYTALVDLLEVPLYEQGKKALSSIFDEIKRLLSGLELIREVSVNSMNTLLSFGEILSTTLIYYRALQLGMKAALLDSRKFMKTQQEDNRNVLAVEKTYQAIRKQLRPQAGLLLIAQGFIASDEQELTTTLGRGGSDYSATIIAAALNADEVQIWTDVNGIMTCDPRVIQQAAAIEELSYEEAAELSYFGAKVIHPAAIQPAVEKNIPVLVKNTRRPEEPGSRIHRRGGRRGIQGIIGKGGVTLVTIQSSRMLNAYGFLRKIFEIFEKHQVPIDIIATSEVSVSLTIDDNHTMTVMEKELNTFSTVHIERNMASISLVGQNLWNSSFLSNEVLAALAHVPLRMISLGGANINLSIVVPREELDPTLRRLHDTLFPQNDDDSGGDGDIDGGGDGEHF